MFGAALVYVAHDVEEAEAVEESLDHHKEQATVGEKYDGEVVEPVMVLETSVCTVAEKVHFAYIHPVESSYGHHS